LREFEEEKIDIEVTVNNKEKNSEDFCLDFVQEFGLRKGGLKILSEPCGSGSEMHAEDLQYELRIPKL
jgi:hypothetical protein